MSDAKTKPSEGEFEVTLDMVGEGVRLYFEYDYEKADPETLVMDILYSARDIWRDGTPDRR